MLLLVLTLLCALAAASTPAQSFIDWFAHFILNLLGLLSHESVSLLGRLPLLFLLTLHSHQHSFELSNPGLPVRDSCLSIWDPCLGSLEFLLKQHDLLLMALGQVLNGLFVAIFDPSHFTIKFFTEKLLQLPLFVSDGLLVHSMISLTLSTDSLDLLITSL